MDGNMVEFLSYVYAIIVLLAASSLSAAIMYATLWLFGLTDFVADMLYSIKVAAAELWHMIVRE